MKLQFSVDALHIIEQMAAEAEAPGIVFGLQPCTYGFFHRKYFCISTTSFNKNFGKVSAK